MSKTIKLLLVSFEDSTQFSELASSLNEQFILTNYDRRTDIQSLCLSNNIDIVVVIPPGKKNASLFSTSRFPENTPLLWLGPEEEELWNDSSFPGMVVFTSSNPSFREISSHLYSLARFNTLNRVVQEKDRQLEALTEKLNQHQKIRSRAYPFSRHTGNQGRTHRPFQQKTPEHCAAKRVRQMCGERNRPDNLSPRP